MSEKTDGKYSGLSIYHKRKILAANRLASMALALLASQGSNNVVRQLQRNAVHYSNTLSEKEIEKQIAEFDLLIEEAKSPKAKSIDEITARRKTRSLFR
jgi:hypothetical protein